MQQELRTLPCSSSAHGFWMVGSTKLNLPGTYRAGATDPLSSVGMALARGSAAPISPSTSRFLTRSGRGSSPRWDTHPSACLRMVEQVAPSPSGVEAQQSGVLDHHQWPRERSAAVGESKPC